MLRRTLTMVCVTAALIGVSACAPADDDKSPPADNTAPPSNVSDPSLSIDKPKNLSAATDPCQLLTPEQLKTLGSDGQPKPEESLYGTGGCVWSDDKFSMTVTPITTLHRDAKRMYLDAKNAGNPEKYRIGGYPAATILKETVTSNVEVSVSKEQSFEVLYAKYSGGTPEMEDPVGYAKKIASEVLKNIPDA